MASSIAATNGKWTCVFPIARLVITEDLRKEVRLHRVVLIAADALRRRGRRLGLPSSAISPKNEVFQRYLNLADAHAIVRLTGTPRRLQQQAASLVRNELALLTISQFSMTHRTAMALPSLVGESPVRTRSSLFVNPSARMWTQPNNTIGQHGQPLVLNREWRSYQANIPLFKQLLRIARGQTRHRSEWRQALVRAATLFGASVATPTITEAFLLNMIAIELLLTRQGDSYSTALPGRAGAMLGWVKGWAGGDVPTQLVLLYKKRCEIVHRGQRDAVTRSDLEHTDDLLLNLLFNIVRHESLFSTREGLESFAVRVRSEQVLGIRPRVRPKTLSFFAWRRQDRDYDTHFL